MVVARLGGRVLPRQSAAERSQTEERYVRVPLSFASYPLWPPPCSTRADRELVSPTELRAYLADWHSDSYAALWGSGVCICGVLTFVVLLVRFNQPDAVTRLQRKVPPSSLNKTRTEQASFSCERVSRSNSYCYLSLSHGRSPCLTNGLVFVFSIKITLKLILNY